MYTHHILLTNLTIGGKTLLIIALGGKTRLIIA